MVMVGNINEENNTIENNAKVGDGDSLDNNISNVMCEENNSRTGAELRTGNCIESIKRIVDFESNKGNDYCILKQVCDVELIAEESNNKNVDKFEMPAFETQITTETGNTTSTHNKTDDAQNEHSLLNNDYNEDPKDELIALNIKTLKNRKRIVIDDSDSDEANEMESKESDIVQDSSKVKFALSDSDSDENEEKSFTQSVKKRNYMLSDSESEENVASHSTTYPTPEIIQKSKWSSLCDSESSEDECHEIRPSSSIQDPSPEEDLPGPKKSKKKNPKITDDDQPKKMTAKEAAEQMKEILSESQRRVREKNISLPYHKPKTHNIKEFLSRRPKLSLTVQLPSRTPPSLAIKMSREQLEIVSKKLKEREEKLKEFYKSESESEDENDSTYVPPEENPKSLRSTNENFPLENGEYSEPPNEENCMKHNINGECKSNSTSVEEIKSSKYDALNDNKEPTDSVEDEEIGIPPVQLNEHEDVQEENKDRLEQNKLDESKNHENVSLNTALEDEINTNVDSGAKELDETHIRESFSMDNLIETEINDQMQDDKNVCPVDELAQRGMEFGTESYDFNLDDVEKSEQIMDKQNSTNHMNFDSTKLGETEKFTFTDLDKEIESFGETNIDSTELPIKHSKLDLIKERLSTIQPKLSGRPDTIIELDSDVTKPHEVTKLMERFAQHNTKKHQHKQKVQLSIVTVESGGDIHKETVAINVGDDDDTVIEEKPGARLQRLREELQNQMAQRKSELWQHKSKNGISGDKAEETLADNEKEGYEGACDDILDDENEEEMTDEDSEEELEDDVDMREKSKEKSAFVDDEAEDEEINENMPNIDTDDKESDFDNGNDEDDSQESKHEMREKSRSPEILDCEPKKRILKRIVKMSDDDSDGEDVDTNLKNILFGKKNQIPVLPESQDDFIPPNQKPETPVRQTSQFHTPVSYITGIQNLNSTSKKYPDIMGINNEPSPLKEINWSSNLQKKLFVDNIPDSQELAEFCAGKFTCTQEPSQAEPNKPSDTISWEHKLPGPLENKEAIEESEVIPSTQDLLNLCSGNFTGISQVTEAISDTVSKPATQVIEFSDNTEIKTLDMTSSIIENENHSVATTAKGDDQDLIISQLIDEEEIENFKKKFNSPEKLHNIEEPKEIMGGGVVDSDDDDDCGNILAVKKRNQRKLQFSDDDSDDSEKEQSDDEEIGLQEDVDADVSVDNIGYDSEENEYEVTSNSGNVESIGKPEKVKLTDFFEAEAELSESEWGSADEDEKDLDTFEQEEGDKEKFDDNKIRNEIEKIHMRKQLDDDIREVKMLQELLLEDGEMHGTGRQRQFKWKNIDSLDGGEENRPVDDEVYMDEEESEEKWRKKRHEREMFIKEEQKKIQDEGQDILIESQLLKLGKKVLERSQSNSSQQNTPPVNQPEKEEIAMKEPFSLLTKRGSFLTRKDQVLKRIAEYTKVVTSVAVGTATAKNSKNFVFQSISTETITQAELKKRKAINTDGTPVAIKKLRLTELSPALNKKPQKSDRVKKLFSNW